MYIKKNTWSDIDSSNAGIQ